MNGGLPPQASFPLTSLQFGVAGVAEGETEVVELSPEQLAGSQQYNIAPAGFPPLQRWAAAHVAALHAPPGPHRVLLTAGASQGLEVGGWAAAAAGAAARPQDRPSCRPAGCCRLPMAPAPACPLPAAAGVLPVPG